MNLAALSAKHLLEAHGGIALELRRRGLIRTGNNLCADLAETVVSRAFGWKLNPNSKAGHDAIDGIDRIEIKACRLGRPNGARQTSAIRKIDTRPFDRLVGVVFDADYTVQLALDIPFEVVRARSSHNNHTNSAIFHLRDSLLGEPGVRNITPIISQTACTLLDDRRVDHQ